MTLVVAVTCPEGVALSSDSRMCLDIPTPPVVVGAKATIHIPPEHVVFTDTVEKVTVMGGRFLVGWAGSATAGTPSAVLAECAADPIVAAAGPDPDAFVPALAAASGRRQPDSSLLVSYVDAAGHPRVFYTAKGRAVAYDTLDPRTKQPLAFGCYPQGYHDLLTRPGGLIEEQGLALGNFTLTMAAELSRWAVQSVADWMSFRTAPRFVGGPILTAVADRTGARMVVPREITVREFGRAAL